jgi:hypothetical protein
MSPKLRKAVTGTWVSGLILCAGLALAPAAQAQFFDGDELQRVCGTGETSAVFSPGVCPGYIMGVIDGLECQGGEGERGKAGFCVPEDESIPRIVDTVIAYVRAHPDRHDDWAGVLIHDALLEAYPCKK